MHLSFRIREAKLISGPTASLADKKPHRLDLKDTTGIYLESASLPPQKPLKEAALTWLLGKGWRETLNAPAEANELPTVLQFQEEESVAIHQNSRPFWMMAIVQPTKERRIIDVSIHQKF